MYFFSVLVRLLCVEVFNVCVWTQIHKENVNEKYFFTNCISLSIILRWQWTIEMRYKQHCRFNELKDAKKKLKNILSNRLNTKCYNKNANQM